MADDAVTIHRASFDELATRDLHDLLQLRSAVFVVEQDCAYLDVDGRDVEPTTEQLWCRDDRGIAACVRLLRGPDPGVGSIGRIVTRPDVRSSGLARRLIERGIAILDADGIGHIDLSAQAHLEGYYERFGFVRAGPTYLEDGIPHVPMRRSAMADDTR